MKKSLLAIAALALASSAMAQSALPGSAWSTLTYNPSPIKGTPEDNNVLLQGRVEQGAIVAKFGDGWRVNTYGALNYSYDRNGLAYNNKVDPQIGVKLQHDVTNTGIIEIGTAVVYQDNFRGVTEGPKSGTGISVYAQYWFGWNLKK